MTTATRNTVTIYAVTTTQCQIASVEAGTRWSLRPWGNNTREYAGYDDGGRVYLLPEGYQVEQVDHEPMIVGPRGVCSIVTHSSGRPQLVASGREMPVLDLA